MAAGLKTPLPNALFSRLGSDDFAPDDSSSSTVDLGRFLTSFIVVTGFSLPLVLAHAEVIHRGACIMSTIGGALVYGTIKLYSLAFREEESEF
ncbi:hypothetical protein Clacol_006369 [Clathrus columnatus]|uniref:Uncharacterized protein n=1 Tax=Clathrus columnatus TaxID=1419009 RepID=A0AAV5AG71_9AGAM|nr:hypothetical protein Clacol_006369 [Clathrus columnatus]